MSSVSVSWLLDVPAPALPDVPLTIPARENYSADEIDASVSKLVQGSIRRPYGALGQRQTGTTFDDTMDAAAGVFILTPAAPFYVLLLGARRLTDVVTGILQTALDLLDAITSTNRNVRPLTNLTSLGNARTALQALETATSARTSAFEDISQTPAFQRFDTHTDRFLSDASASIKSGSQIVQTPQQARSALAGLVSQLTSGYQDIQRRVGLLEAGIDDYNSLNLPALLSQGVISKARSVLQDRIDQLEPLTPTERLEFLRDTVLDVLTGKAVVAGFGSLARSGEFVSISGQGAVFSDADHLGNPATLPAAIGDPYSIVAGADSLLVTIDGGPGVLTLPLPRSFLARAEGTIPEPFVIDGTSDKLTVLLSGFTNVLVTLTHGTRSVTQVCADINAAVTTQPLVAEPYFNPEKFNGPVNTAGATPTTLQFVRTIGPWTDLSVVVGDLVLVQDPLSTMDGRLFSITVVAGSTLTTSIVGAGTPVNASGVNVAVGGALRFLRLRISDSGALAALNASLALTVPSVTNGAATTLGIFPGTSLRCRRTRADEVADGINQSPGASVARAARLVASSALIETDALSGRTETSDVTKVVSSVFRATGDLTIGGTSVTVAVAGAAAAGVAPGDVLTLRSALVAAEVGLFGSVVTVTDTQVTATLGSAASVATGLDLEFGRNLGATRDTVVRIASDSPLSGDYRTLDPAPNPSELLLDRTLPFSVGPGGQPVAFSMQVSHLQVLFASTSTGLDSELAIDGPAATLFFQSPPGRAIGASRFVLLPNDPKVLSVGDRFEIYDGQYDNPTLSTEIIGFERGEQLIEVQDPVDNSFIALDFSFDVPTPFARLRKVERNNYDLFSTQLGQWLALAVNQPLFFSNLNRFLNPLIVNENPTISAVNTASLQVQTLVQALQQLQVILGSYQVDTVPRVDTLITSFLDKGSDRAVDTLLEGQFTAFFGYNSEEASYAGNALERLRDVSRLDLPVRRTNRKEVADQELTLGQFEEPDFEFDQSDIQDADEPDLPGSFTSVPGSNF